MSSDREIESSGPAAGAAPGSRWPDVLIVVGLTVVAALAAALGFFHLAWRWGAAPVPVSPIVLAVIVWALARGAHQLMRALWAAAAPWIGCLLVIGLLYFAGNTHWRLPLRVVTMDHATNQATDGDWRGLLLLGVLVLTAAVQLSLLWAVSVAAGAAAERVTPTTSGPSGDGGSGPGWILEHDVPAPREQSPDQTRNSRRAQK